MAVKRLTSLNNFLDVKNARKGMIAPNISKPSVDFSMQDYVGLPCAVPEDVGVSSLDIAHFLLELERDETLNPHNIIIVKNGQKIAEAYYGGQKKGVWKATFSACKSITAIAIGMLIDEGKLSLDDKLVDVFEEELTTVARLKMRDITIYHLLTMTSGMKTFDEIRAISSGELFKTYVNTALSDVPGDKFIYNSTNTFMLSAIVKKVSGKGLCEYLDKKLFAPLGIKKYYWEKGDDGIEFGGWGLYILQEDLAKIGVLLLNGGEYDGKRLLSSKYIKLATKDHSKGTGSPYGFNYGFQMWTDERDGVFLFNGMLGQNVWGFKNSGLVIVNNSGNNELFQQSNYYAIAKKYFNRKFPSQINRSRKDYAFLQKTVNGLSKNQMMGERPFLERTRLYKGRLPWECSMLNGLTLCTSDERAVTSSIFPLVWQSLENNFSQGFDSLCFELKEGSFYMTYGEKDESYRIELGFGRAKYTEIYVHNAPYLVGASAAFAKDEDGRKILKIRVDFVETPCSVILKLVLCDGYYELYQKETPGKPFVLEKIMEIKKELSQMPIIGGVASLLEDDVLEYRIERMFEFKLRLYRK